MAVKLPTDLQGIKLPTMDEFDTPDAPTVELSDDISGVQLPNMTGFRAVRGDSMEMINSTPDPEAEAGVVKSAITNNLGFDIPFKRSYLDNDIINEVAAKQPHAKYRQEQANEYMSAISAIGASEAQQGRIQTFTGEMTEAEARKQQTETEQETIKRQLGEIDDFLANGQIKQEEADKAKAEIEETGKPLRGGRGTGNLFRGEDLTPASLYDKTWSERAGEFLPGVGAGVNMFMAGFYGGERWIEAETGIQLNAKAAQDFMLANANRIAPKRQDFVTDVFTGFGSLLVPLATAGVGEAVAGAVGISALWAGYAGLGFATGTESFVNAGNDFSAVLDETGDEHKAMVAGRTSMVLNTGVGFFFNRFGLFGGRLANLRKISKLGPKTLSKSRASTVMRGIRDEIKDKAIVGAKGFVGEGGQEGSQEIISAIAQKKPIEANKVAYATVLGGIIGGPAAVMLSYAETKIDEVPELSPEIQNLYDTTVREELDNGATKTEADIVATKKIAETPEGLAHIEKVSEAMDAMMMAEAGMTDKTLTVAEAERSVAVAKAQLTEAPEVAEVVTEEDIKSLVEEDLTDDEIDARIDELITQAETVDVEPEVIADEQAVQEAEQAEPELIEFISIEQAKENLKEFIGGEEGFVDLNSEVSLAPILEKLQTFGDNVQQGMQDVLTLGRNIFAEGRTSFNNFVARMRQVTGNVYDSIRPYLKSAWDILNNERGAIGRPEPTKTTVRRTTGQIKDTQARKDLRESLVAQTKLAREAIQGETVKARVEEIITETREKFKQLTEEAKPLIEAERNTRREVTALIAENLPVALRGKYAKSLANAKTLNDFEKINTRVAIDIALFEETKILKKNLGSLRSKIAFIRKVGELNQTVVNEVRAEVGLDKPLRSATEDQLNQIIDKMKARLRFKRSRGFKPPIEGKETKSPDIPENLYKANRDIKATTKTGFRKRLSDTKEATGEFTDKILGVISTRLANIDPSLRQALRRFEFGVAKQTQQDKRKAVPYLDKVAKLNKEDFEDLDLALKNGDIAKIKDITERNDMVKEYEAVREVLDDVYKRAKEVGFDIGYRQNYFPRVITDTEGFLDYFHGRDDWSIIDEAIKRKELALGRVLNEDEKANLINNMIRGYSGGGITLSDTGAMKQRVIDFVGPEINKFYENANSSLLNYIDATDNAIEQRKFFGKTLPVDKKTEEFNNLEDSIGAYITNLIAEQKIAPSQEKEIRQILQARFGEAGTSGLIGIYKNLAYLTVMGSPFNAITQIGDLAFALYAGGPKNVLTSLGKAIIGDSVITKEDIGIDRIAAEMNTNSKMAELVDRVFRMTGLTAIDTLGKESLINSVVLKYQALAKNPTPKFTSKMEEVFGDETQEVINELASGIITENVKYLAFNELLNFQPAALSEVPQAYLTAGNGRIFYMLKTWTIKMLDVYRNEVFRTMKTDKVQATKNMIGLATLLMLMNASADVLKDLLLGRELDPEDIAIDNIAKLIGFSRYSVSQVGRDGVGSALLDQILPPTNLVDNISKDVTEAYRDWPDSVEVNKLKTIQDIPLIGKLYYWWFGRGVDSRRKRNKDNRRR